MPLAELMVNLFNQTPMGRKNALRPGDIVRIHPGATGIQKNDAVSRRQREFWEESIGEVISDPDFNGRVEVKVRRKSRLLPSPFLEKVGPCEHQT